MNDEEFCQAIGCTSGIKRNLAEKIREVTAALCQLDPAAISPGEDTDKLSSRMFDGWDELKFLMQLERILDVPLDGLRLPNFIMSRFFFFYREAKPLNYGEWVKKVVEVLAPIVDQGLGERLT
jgi:hypothetical protein